MKDWSEEVMEWSLVIFIIGTIAWLAYNGNFEQKTLPLEEYKYMLSH